MLEIKTYTRKPFPVKAVEVTAENMEEVAKWCKGEVRKEGDLEKPTLFIKVKVHFARSDRQTKAFVGDFVLQDENRRGFKVYPPASFKKAFDNFVEKDKQTEAVNG